MYILIDGNTGEMYEARESESGNYLVTVGLTPLPVDHPVRQAQKIGQKVLEVIRDDEEIDDNGGVVHLGYEEHGGPGFLRIWLKQKKPKPLVGKKWLISLPLGARRKTPGGHCFVRLCDGLHWSGGAVWTWGDIRKKHCPGTPWISEASDETCPEW